MPPLLRLPPRRLVAAAVLVAAGAIGCTQLDAWQRSAIFSPQAEQLHWWREPHAGTEV